AVLQVGWRGADAGLRTLASRPQPHRDAAAAHAADDDRAGCAGAARIADHRAADRDPVSGAARYDLRLHRAEHIHRIPGDPDVLVRDDDHRLLIPVVQRRDAELSRDLV